MSLGSTHNLLDGYSRPLWMLSTYWVGLHIAWTAHWLHSYRPVRIIWHTRHWKVEWQCPILHLARFAQLLPDNKSKARRPLWTESAEHLSTRTVSVWLQTTSTKQCLVFSAFYRLPYYAKKKLLKTWIMQNDFPLTKIMKTPQRWRTSRSPLLSVTTPHFCLWRANRLWDRTENMCMPSQGQGRPSCQK